jgi:hypothetical protein
MTMKLTQKVFLKGTREFEIIEETVYVRKKGLIKEERLTISLSTLNPEPVVKGEVLEFHGLTNRGPNPEPLLSLLLNNPNADEFNAFIDALKQGAVPKQETLAEDKTSASFEIETPESVRAEALARNVYEEPPDFDEPQEKEPFQPVNAERVAADITMLKTYLDDDELKPLLDALETLQAEPQSEAAFEAVVAAFNKLGLNQGAVLTYAPYLKVLVSKTIFT